MGTTLALYTHMTNVLSAWPQRVHYLEEIFSKPYVALILKAIYATLLHANS